MSAKHCARSIFSDYSDFLCSLNTSFTPACFISPTHHGYLRRTKPPTNRCLCGSHGHDWVRQEYIHFALLWPRCTNRIQPPGLYASYYSILLISIDKTQGTQEVGIYKCKWSPSIDIYLVDTPGFDDTNRSDTDVLKAIATWLTKSYAKDVRLNGILYLH